MIFFPFEVSLYSRQRDRCGTQEKHHFGYGSNYVSRIQVGGRGTELSCPRYVSLTTYSCFNNTCSKPTPMPGVVDPWHDDWLTIFTDQWYQQRTMDMTCNVRFQLVVVVLVILGLPPLCGCATSVFFFKMLNSCRLLLLSARRPR